MKLLAALVYGKNQVLILKKWSGLNLLTFLYTLCPVKEQTTAWYPLHVCGKCKRSKHELTINCSSVCLILNNVLIIK